ncbi:MAG: S9 family peptidase [Flavobacteriaceae bacterium]|nr:S9 family peptidase [Flavobacteriaceae bacterium]
MLADAQIIYPKTKKGTQTDNYHGTTVADPYRWLEDDTAATTKAWVKQQNAITQKYMDQIPYRASIKKRITELNNFAKYSQPMRAGAYYLFYKNDGLQNQAVIYRQNGIDGEPTVFLDPNTYSKEGTVSLSLLGFSKNDRFVAYGVQRAGSDWQEIHIKEIHSGQELTDKLEWVKFSGAAWWGNGFFYSRYDKPEKGMEFSSKNEYHKVYYHTLNTSQDQDSLVYEDKNNPMQYYGAEVTEDDRFIILNVSQGTYGNELWYKDTKKEEVGFKPLFDNSNFANEYNVIDNTSDKLLVLTNLEAANRRVVLVDPENHSPANWKTVVPTQKELLEGAVSGGGKLYVNYLRDCSSRIYQYSFDGMMEREIRLPGNGTAGGFGGKKEDKDLFYTYTSFNYPSVIFKYTIESGESKIFRKPDLKFDPEAFEVKQEFYTGKDGTKVPMFIVHKKGLAMSGKNPTLLYGYGGFNINLSPSFSASRIMFMEQGGVLAVANLRGGGEYGEDWHSAGMKLKKQNVFNDFISAAEYLIAKKYTSKDYLAIQGGSNGGLLVGACMAQRPELFKVALPAVGVMDMLRYHKFTVGWGWVVEYGSSDSANHFKNLYKYSPLHNLKAGVNYPATLVTTADHDDRVVPAHSFKFISTLQEKHKGPNPVMIRIETNAGHGAGKPISKQIEETADIYSFLFWNMDVTTKF